MIYLNERRKGPESAPGMLLGTITMHFYPYYYLCYYCLRHKSDCLMMAPIDLHLLVKCPPLDYGLDTHTYIYTYMLILDLKGWFIK